MVTASNYFKVPRKNILGLLFTLYGIIPTLVLFVLTQGLIIVGVWASDARWGILALMCVFLITPLVMAFLYFFYGLRELTACNTLRHKVILEGDSLVIDINDSISDRKGKAKTKESTYVSKTDNHDTVELDDDKNRIEVIRTVNIPISEIGTIKVGLSRVSLPVGKNGTKGVVCLSPEAFDSSKDFQTFVENLIEVMRKAG